MFMPQDFKDVHTERF